jgi:hypothetical protein
VRRRPIHPPPLSLPPSSLPPSQPPLSHYLNETQIVRDLTVSRHSKKKQQLLELLAVLHKLGEATALRETVKRAQEGKDFAAALLTCLECAQSLESILELQVRGSRLGRRKEAS